jgi:hypothetical protein
MTLHFLHAKKASVSYLVNSFASMGDHNVRLAQFYSSRAVGKSELMNRRLPSPVLYG